MIPGLVSVIVPTYNRSTLLARTLTSLFEQTYHSVEIIVVDDASDDDTAEVITPWQARGVRYLRLARNGGPSAARNAGLEIVQGEFTAFLDSDDEYLPHKLERQVALLTQQPATTIAVECGQIASRPSYSIELPATARNGLDSVLEFRSSGNHTPNFLYRTTAIASLRWDTTVPPYDDYDFLLQVLLEGSIECVDEPLVRVHHHSGSRVSSDPHRQLVAVNLLFSKYEPLISARPRALAWWHTRLGRLNMAVGQRRTASAHFKVAASLDRDSRWLHAASALGAFGGLPLVPFWFAFRASLYLKRRTRQLSMRTITTPKLERGMTPRQREDSTGT